MKIRKENNHNNKNKNSVSLAKILYLRLCSPMLVLELMTGGYSVPSLSKVPIFCYMGKVATSLVGQLGWGVSAEGFFFSHFPQFYGLSVTNRSSEMVSADG
jgi:hypothetical protein